MKQIRQKLLLQSNFPISQAGKLGDVYYQILNQDGTIFEPRTNIGVLEIGDGKYGVNYIFNEEKGYSIKWDIDGTKYTTGEEINILDYRKVPDQYNGFGR